MNIELDKIYYIARGKKVGTLIIDSVGRGTVFYRETLNGKASLVKSTPIEDFKAALLKAILYNSTWYGNRNYVDLVRLACAAKSFGVPSDTLEIKVTRAPSAKAGNGAYKHVVVKPTVHDYNSVGL